MRSWSLRFPTRRPRGRAGVNRSTIGPEKLLLQIGKFRAGIGVARVEPDSVAEMLNGLLESALRTAQSSQTTVSQPIVGLQHQRVRKVLGRLLRLALREQNVSVIVVRRRRPRVEMDRFGEMPRGLVQGADRHI